ncbi:CBN-CYP-14A1 protein [Aphelenchoides avenae]|nr:CBN-CYP-14A1 protein [Aphelenchus avenae]
MQEQSAKYGPVFTLFTPRPIVCLNTYETIKEALTSPQTFFSDGKPNKGILNGYDQNWREQRRVSLRILRHFGTGKGRIEQKVMGSVADMLDNLEGMEDKTAVDMFGPLMLCVGNIINETLLGFMYKHSDSKEFLHFVQHIVDFLKSFRSMEIMVLQSCPFLKHLPPLSSAYRKVDEKMKMHFEFIASEAKQQMSIFDPDAPARTFVQAYLKEIQKDNNPFLNFEQLVYLLSDFWMDRMETTTTTMRWALMYLVKWPHIQRKAQAEIDSVIGRDRFPTSANQIAMPYTNALIAEIQRYAPVVSTVPHLCTEAQKVGGHNVPANTLVFVNFSNVLSRDPAFEEPDKFNPERFLESDGRTLRKDLLERLIAFGVGKRHCASEALARMSNFLILTSLLQRFTFEATGPVDLTPNYSVVTQPRTDHKYLLVPRV